MSVLNIYDFDDVEIHNIPNQYYDTEDLGKLKAEALADKLHAINPNITVKCTHQQYYLYMMKKHPGIDQMSGYVFLLVDSMKIRKELWLAAKEKQTNLTLLGKPFGEGQTKQEFIFS